MNKLLLFALVILWIVILSSGCTISFQNISTAGKAEDVVDEELKTNAEVTPTLSIPKI
jgi:hypothetical protein